MNIYKILLIFIINLTCCVFQENITNETLPNIEKSRTATKFNITNIVFDKCCDDGELFDVITKRCILITTDANTTNESRQNEISLGALVTKLLVI